MAFFSTKKNRDNVAKKSVDESVKTTKAVKASKKVLDSKAETKEVAVAKTVVASVGGADFSHDLGSVIVRPRVTEKATTAAENGVYVFEVSKDSTKSKIARAVLAMYKVAPEKVRVVSLPAKSVFVRGKWGRKSAIKKAYIYLKKGDKIEII
jgi:large subunit ribosomal protein L23